jgi:hypothetical protein
VVRINPAEIDRAAAEPGYQVDYLLYDETDGLEESLWPRLGRPHRGARQRRAVVVHVRQQHRVIDPRRLPERRTVASRTSIASWPTGMLAAPDQQVVLPGGTETLQIQFSALSLTSASKLRFRYRLDGLEQQWRYPGPIRTRPMRASRRASTSSASRPRPTASGARTKRCGPSACRRRSTGPAHFYAAGACVGGPARLGRMVAAPAIGEALLHAWHSTSGPASAGRFTTRCCKASAAWRSNWRAVAVELDAASLPSTGDGVRRLRRQVSRCVVEARRSIAELRSPALQTHGLPGALRDIGQRAADGKSLNIQVSVVGRARRLGAIRRGAAACASARRP